MKIYLTGAVVESNGVATNGLGLIRIALEYEVENPLVLKLIFRTEPEEDVSWFIGRDLFLQCFEEGEAGGGDVILIDTGSFVTLVLMSPDGTAVIQIHRHTLEPFVEQTTRIIPAGREPLDAAIDSLIEEILSES